MFNRHATSFDERCLTKCPSSRYFEYGNIRVLIVINHPCDIPAIALSNKDKYFASVFHGYVCTYRICMYILIYTFVHVENHALISVQRTPTCFFIVQLTWLSIEWNRTIQEEEVNCTRFCKCKKLLHFGIRRYTRTCYKLAMLAQNYLRP